MIIDLTLFIISFLADTFAYIFYQKYIDTHHKSLALFIYAIISAFLVWFCIFKLQDRGQTLRVFIPAWAGGSAIFGYLVAGIANRTPMKELLNIQAMFCVVAIGVGIYFLNRVVIH